MRIGENSYRYFSYCFCKNIHFVFFSTIGFNTLLLFYQSADQWLPLLRSLYKISYATYGEFHLCWCRPSGVVVRGVDCYTKGPGSTVHPWPHQCLHSKTGRQEVPDSFFGRVCRPSCSEFSVFFSETRVNTG